MRYYRFIFVLGLWVIIVPFLGVPLLAKKILLIVPGALLLLIGILMSQAHRREEHSETGISYAERKPAPSISSFPAVSVDDETDAEDLSDDGDI